MKSHNRFSEIGCSPEKCLSTSFSLCFRAVRPSKPFYFLLWFNGFALDLTGSFIARSWSWRVLGIVF
jgi:hypothetical protein